jgi:hypothetical protein
LGGRDGIRRSDVKLLVAVVPKKCTVCVVEEVFKQRISAVCLVGVALLLQALEEGNVFELVFSSAALYPRLLALRIRARSDYIFSGTARS